MKRRDRSKQVVVCEQDMAVFDLVLDIGEKEVYLIRRQMCAVRKTRVYICTGKAKKAFRKSDVPCLRKRGAYRD